MPEYGPSLEDYQPSWMEDGGGIGSGTGGDLSSETSYGENDVTSARSWDMLVWSQQNQESADISGGRENCTPPGSPDTGIRYVKTTAWDGSKWVCEWFPTTSCS